MANLTTSADIIDDILFRAGEPQNSTSDFYTVSVIYLNRAYQALWSGATELDPSLTNQTWWWLRKSTPGVLTILPVVKAGTVSVTNNSTAITFSSAPAASVAGYFFKVDGHADVFRISTHTAAAAAAVLDGVFTGATDTAAAYNLRKLEYDLASDVMSVIAPMRSYQDGVYEIHQIELKELELEWPLAEVHTGVPRKFAIVGERLTASDAMTIRVSHGGSPDSTTDFIRVDYDYLQVPTDLADDTAEPLIPRQFRKVLADFALAFLFQDKEDTRAAGAIQLAQRGLKAMVHENQARWATASRTLGMIYPRLGQRQWSQRVLRTSSGHLIG